MRVVSKYPKEFSSPAAAEEHYFGVPDEPMSVSPVSENEAVTTQQLHSQGGQLGPLSLVTCLHRQMTHQKNDGTHQEAVVKVMPTAFDELQAMTLLFRKFADTDKVGTNIQQTPPPTPDEELQAVTVLFRKFALTHYQVDVNDDFLSLALRSFQHLKSCGRSNVLYGLARAIGRSRPDGTDSRLPAKRMPMGLLEYLVNFFNADSYQKVRPTLLLIIVYNNAIIDWTMSLACYHVLPVWKQVG